MLMTRHVPQAAWYWSRAAAKSPVAMAERPLLACSRAVRAHAAPAGRGRGGGGVHGWRGATSTPLHRTLTERSTGAHRATRKALHGLSPHNKAEHTRDVGRARGGWRGRTRRSRREEEGEDSARASSARRVRGEGRVRPWAAMRGCGCVCWGLWAQGEAAEGGGERTGHGQEQRRPDHPQHHRHACGAKVRRRCGAARQRVSGARHLVHLHGPRPIPRIVPARESITPS